MDHGWNDVQKHLGTLWLQVAPTALPGGPSRLSSCAADAKSMASR